MGDPTENAEELLRFDPFEEPAAAPVEQQPTEGTPVDGAPDGVQDMGQQQQPPAGVEQRPAEPGAPQGTEDDLRAELAMLRAQIAQQQVPAQQQAPAQQQPAAQQPGAAQPNWQWQIPDEMVQGVMSADPNVVRQTLANLATGLSQGIFSTVQAQMAEMVQPHIGRHLTEFEQQRQIASDFYGKYEDLQGFAPVVLQVAQEMAQRTGAQTWNAQFRDQVAQEAYRRLGRQPPRAQQQRPAGFVPRAASPSPAPAGSTEQQQMLDLLNF